MSYIIQKITYHCCLYKSSRIKSVLEYAMIRLLSALANSQITMIRHINTRRYIIPVLAFAGDKLDAIVFATIDIYKQLYFRSSINVRVYNLITQVE